MPTNHSAADQGESGLISTQVRFAPWVGSAYEEGLDGVRTLLVCESHYGPKLYERPTVTPEIIKALALGERHTRSTYKMKRHPHFAKIMCSVKGLETSRGFTRVIRNGFWSQVAYYNFIQLFIPTCRKAPKPEEWEHGKQPFVEVLQALQPDVIICFSKRNGDRVRSLSGAVPVVVINHPSSHFSYVESNPKISLGFSACREGLNPQRGTIDTQKLDYWKAMSRQAQPSRGPFIHPDDKPAVLAEWARQMSKIDGRVHNQT